MFYKVIRELVMYWRARGINILFYLDDLLFMITGCEACRALARIVEEDMRLAGLSINWEKTMEHRHKNGFIYGLLLILPRACLKFLFDDGKPLKHQLAYFYLPKVLEFKHGNSQAWLAQSSP